MRRFFKYTLLTLVLLVTVLIVAFAYIIATESGTHFAWTIARGILPEGLKIATVEGRLLGPLTVRGVDYHAKNFHLSVGEGQLRWAPRDLIITRTLNVDVVAVDNVRYTQLGSAPLEPKKKSEPLSLPRRIDLPLNVRLGEFRLQDVKYQSAPVVKPVVLRQAILSASLIKDRLTVARLAIDAPLLSLDGNAQMTASNDFALQGAFNWQARLPHYPTVKGHTRLDGGLLRTLRIQQTVRAPYNTNAQVVVTDPLKQTRFNAVLNVKALALRTIDPKLPPTTLNLALKAVGVPDNLELHAKAAAKDVQYGTLVLALDGGFADQVATVEKLAVSSPEQPAQLNAHGRIALKGKQPEFDVKARWQQLRWPLSGNPQFASRNGRLDIDGSMHAARARIAAAVNGTALVQAGVKGEETLKTQFSGGFAKQTKLIKIDNLDVTFAKQRLSTQGRVSLAGKQPDIDLSTKWRHLRWPLVGKPLVASPEGVVAVQGTPRDFKAKLHMGVGEDGHIKGAAKRAGESINLALKWRQLRWPLVSKAQVQSSRGELDVDGTIAALRTKLTAALRGPAIANAGIKDEQILRANFSGGFAKQILKIKKFRLGLVEQPTRLTATGQVVLSQKQPAFDLDVGWRQIHWPLVGAAQVESSQGSLNIEGTLEAARAKLHAALGGGALLLQAGTGKERTLALNFAGGFAQQTKTLTIDKLALALAQQRLTSHGRVSLQGQQPELDLQTTWQQVRWPLAGEPQITSPHGEVTAKGTPRALDTKFNIEVGEDGRINGNAKHTGESIDLALNWRALQWPLEAPQVVSPAGNLTVAGPLTNYQTKLNAQIDSPPNNTSARMHLAGRGSLEFLDLTRISIKALQGQLTGNASVAWTPTIIAKVALDADGLNPGEAASGWPGRLELRLRADAGIQNGGFVAQLDQLEVGGHLRGNPLQLNARGAYSSQGLRLDKFLLISRDSFVETEGLVGDTLDVDARIKSPDLGQLLPNANGKIDGQGSVSGPLKNPKVEARLTGAGLQYQTFQLQSLNLGANVDLSSEAPSHLTVALENGQVGNIALNKFSLNGEGDLAAHTFNLTARTSTGDADVALTGALEHPWQPDMLWRFQLDKAGLKYPQLAAWQLPSPITGMINAERAELSRGCWRSGEAKLCLQGERSTAGWHGAVEVKNLAFTYLAPLLPPDIRLDGKLSAQGEFEQPVNDLMSGTMHVMTSAGCLASVVAGVDTQAGPVATPAVACQGSTLLDFRPSNIDFEMGERGMHLAAALRLAGAGGVHVEAGVPQGTRSITKRPLSGQITTNIPDLSFLAQLAPNMGRLKGRLNGDMRLAGTLKTPEIFGKLALIGGSIVLNGPGIILDGLRAQLTGKGKDGIQLNASARSGGGTLDVGGRFKFAGSAGPRANIGIHGQAFQIVNTVDARASASPDLRVRMRTGRVDIAGEVRVPHASITPKKLPSSAVPVSSDQVIVEPGSANAQATKVAGTDVYARVRLILAGEADDLVDDDLTDKINESPVHINAFGLAAGLQGQLLVVEKPGEPTQGSGELQIIDGTYQAYGQNLTIEKGSILFPGGPITAPGLEVTAVRGDFEDRNVRVGVNVRGSLKQPKFELFSDPSMTQQEQLSYLVLGQAPGASSGGESSLLAQAALALGLKGGNFLAQNLGSKLGLDEVGIESDSDQGEGAQASLVIGKYLSPRLYVSYGIGLLNSISILRVQYTITKSLQLVTESRGVNSGGDIIYTIERGK